MTATNSPSRSAFGGFVNDRTGLEAFEAEAAAQHAETAVPASRADATGPEEFEMHTPGAQQTQGPPGTLDALMAQMALLEQMAKDGAEMKIKVKALEAFVTPGADPWPGLAGRRMLEAAQQRFQAWNLFRRQ